MNISGIFLFPADRGESVGCVADRAVLLLLREVWNVPFIHNQFPGPGSTCISVVS